MADRYWVGGNGVWGASNTTNWSASSGGAGGASVPTSADNVFIDANSGATNIQLEDTTTLACADFTVTKSGLTIAYQTVAASNLNCYGSWSLLAGTTWTARTTITFKATTTGKTISFNGVSLPGGAVITFDGVGGGWTLGSALTITESYNFSLYFLNGSFNSGNYNITCTGFATAGTGTRSITLGTSTINSTSAGIRFNTVTGLTFSGASSTFNVSGSTVFIGGGLTFGTVNYLTNSGTLTISGNNTFTTFATSATAPTLTFTSGSTQTFTNFNVSGTAGNLVTINATSVGSQATLSKASGTVNSNYLSIRDSNATGGATWNPGLNSTNVGNNTGWTFANANYRYWVGGTGTWDTTSTANWSMTSGGTAGAAAPTASDNVYFDANSGTGTCTISGSVSCFDLSFGGSGTINPSTGYPTTPSWYTGTVTGGTSLTIYGGFVKSNSMTWGTAPTTVNFSATTTGKYIYHDDGSAPIYNIVNFNGTGGAWTIYGGYFSGSTITISAGDVTITGASSYLYCSNLTVSGSTTKSLTLNGVTHYVNGNLSFSGATNFTFTPGTSTINIGSNLTGISSTVNTTFYNVYFNVGTSSQTLSGLLTFNDLRLITSSNNTIYRSITFDTSPLTVNGQFYTTTNPTYLAMSRVQFLYSGSTSVLAGIVTCNGTTNLTNIDFKNVYVKGTAAPISGTSIGNLSGCKGISFDNPKTVYWGSSLSTGSWNSLAWSLTSGGTASYTAFPLPQDTAKFDNSSGVGGALTTITFNSVYGWVPTVDMSTRTGTMTASIAASITVYGSWINGSGTTIAGSSTLTFSKETTQTIISAGKTFSTPITVASLGGTVELGDALSLSGSATLSVDHGTFDTKNYALSLWYIQSTSLYVRSIKLGSSTVTINGNSFIIYFGTSAPNLTFDAGTSTIIHAGNGGAAIYGADKTFYNYVSNVTNATNPNNIYGTNTFNNVTITGPAAGVKKFILNASQTINGTLSFSSTSATTRVMFHSEAIGTSRTLTVSTFAAGATDIDFRDINIAGASASISGTRFGDCGNNSGITFPSPKTVYWNLSGAQNWSSNGWALTSGGTPATNNFPLAQDTVVFDNTGAAGTVTIDYEWNFGTFNASARTTSMTLAFGNYGYPYCHGNWTFGTGISVTLTYQSIYFVGRGTSTITCNGVYFNCGVNIDSAVGTIQLGDAFFHGDRALQHLSGTFDAVTYNVTAGCYFQSSSRSKTLKMGSGTWTIYGITYPTQCWSIGSGLTFYKGTANLLFSDTSTTGRTFIGGSLSYNKLTIGGSTGTSTFTISGNNQFTELASTKTVAHTIALGATTQTVGAWTVTGTVGNVVTITGTATLIVAGARVTGVNYLALGTTTLSSTSPGEFYAGAGSTGGTNFIITTAPAATTRYWRGGTGTWDATTTTNWSASSGGAGGASVPTSADAVIFDSASNATAYTVTCTATQLRCASLTITGPASGNVTWAGTAPLAIHGNVTLPVTGLSRSYTGAITLSSSSTGRTFTANGNLLTSAIEINGVGCAWTLGSALNNVTGSINITNGVFNTGNYAVTAGNIASSNSNTRTISFGSSTLTLSATVVYNTGSTEALNLTFNCGTSTITSSATNMQFTAANTTFYNVSHTTTAVGTFSVNAGGNTFNNLSITGVTTAGLKTVSFAGNQTINGTLMLSAGTNATMRTFVQSDTLGTTRTLTCAAFSGTDTDFRDITIAGAAAPVSGTRLGDCKGNSGITFAAGTNKYWNLATGGNLTAVGWATSSGGTPDVNNFPLAQDAMIFEATGLNSGSTITIDKPWNIGTIDMSARTTNTMTLSSTGTTYPYVYGNWINGTGITFVNSISITFSGRGSQYIVSAGKTFLGDLGINTPGGTVTFLDSYTNSSAANGIYLYAGTLNANDYNVSLTGGGGVLTFSTTTATTIALGSGTWALSRSSTAWNIAAPTQVTVTGTGTINLTSGSAKTFAGGGLSYSGITLNQGGAGTLTITGNNTFKDITNTYGSTGATAIYIANTTQTVLQFTATGTVGKVLTITGNTTATPGILILIGSLQTASINYLNISNVAFYVPNLYWYLGTASTGSFSGAYLLAGTIVSTANGNFFLFF